MSILDGLLGLANRDATVENLANRVGLSLDEIERAVTALGEAHTSAGDTAETAAANTGLPISTMQEIVGHLRGEGSLSKIAGMMGGASGTGQVSEGLSQFLSDSSDE